jgi:hypothetical protein
MARADNSTFIIAQKLRNYYQSAANSAPTYTYGPFEFSANSNLATTITPPGESAVVLTTSQGNSGYNYNQYFATQSALDTAFPDGSYQFAVTGHTAFSLSLTGDHYPQVPYVTSSSTNAAMNSDGLLVVNPALSCTLQLNPYTDYGTTGALSHEQIQIQLFNGNGNSLTQTNITPGNASAFTSYTIAAATLQPGTAYEVEIDYDTVPSDNTSAVPGYTAGTVYSSVTQLTLVTSGTPPNAPTINQQPTDQQSPIGTSVTFNISSSNNVQVQWYKNGVAIGLLNNNNSGSPNLQLTNIQNSDAASYYALVIGNDGSYVKSNTVTLTIGPSNNPGQNFITAQKVKNYYQTSTSAPLAYEPGPFEFRGDSPVGPASFTPPGLTSVTLTQGQGDNGDYSVDDTFGTQALLDAAFPDGSYTFAITGSASFALALTGDSYPTVPQVNGGTYNSDGQLVIDPTQSYTLNLSQDTAYGSIGAISHMELKLQSLTGDFSQKQEAFTPGNASPFNAYVIPAGTLTAGNIYSLEVDFDTVLNDSTTDVSGYTVGTVYSSDTSLIIVTQGTGSSTPSISQQPTSQAAPIGGSASFSIALPGGSNADTFWFKNNMLLTSSNAQGATLTINNVQNSDAANYFAIVANSGGGYVKSNTVTLSIGSVAAPTFTLQPSSQTIEAGQTVVLGVAATGSPTYSWTFNGNPLTDGNGVSGSTGPTLVLSPAVANPAGSYVCTATNGGGSVQSQTATLTLSSTSDPGRLLNISCRAITQSGGDQMIVGFVIGGPGTNGNVQLPVLIRASGPTLGSFGVGGTIPDPQVTLNQSVNGGNVLVDSNAVWGGKQAIIDTAAAVGAFSWAAGSKDSALLETLPSSGYTAQVTGVSNDSGVVLAEVYDATASGAYLPTNPRIINVSTRVEVGTGGNILIAGFVIGGSTSKTVLIRATGPTLASFGLSGVLLDPQLTLNKSLSGGGNQVLQSNTGWGGNSQIAAAANSVGAFSWASNSVDSAILITLPPGAYTAEIGGASNDSGVALVEVYEVP